jgi:hypothetical protein
MRLRTTIEVKDLVYLARTKTTAMRHPAVRRPLVGHKDVGKNNEDCQKLKPDPPPHQFLAQVRAGALHHIPQAKKQHDENGKNSNRSGMIENRLHQPYPQPNPGFCLSLPHRVGNLQVAEPTAHLGAKTFRRQSITHLKFALGWKSLNFSAASFAHPVSKRATTTVLPRPIRPST